jgi:hypothetical protein
VEVGCAADVSEENTAIIIRAEGEEYQPTKKLTNGGVLCKRRTTSLARLDDSCVGDMLTLTGLMSWLKALICSD